MLVLWLAFAGFLAATSLRLLPWIERTQRVKPTGECPAVVDPTAGTLERFSTAAECALWSQGTIVAPWKRVADGTVTGVGVLFVVLLVLTIFWLGYKAEIHTTMKNIIRNIQDWHPGQLGIVLVGLVLIGFLAPDIGRRLLDMSGSEARTFGTFTWVVVLAIGLTVSWKWFAGRQPKDRGGTQ